MASSIPLGLGLLPTAHWADALNLRFACTFSCWILRKREQEGERESDSVSAGEREGVYAHTMVRELMMMKREKSTAQGDGRGCERWEWV